MSTHRFLVWHSGVSLLLLTACGGGSDDGGGGPGAVVTSVEVSPGNQSVTSGAQVQYRAVARDGSGKTISGKTYSWVSSQTGVATISNSGRALTFAQGQTQITATTDGVSGQTQLTVTGAPSGATIQGTVTLTGTYLSPPRPAAAQQPTGDDLQRPSFVTKAADYGTPIPGGVRWESAIPFATHARGEWVVTFRSTAVPAPAPGSSAFASVEVGASVVNQLRNVLAPHLSSATTLAGISPTLLAARVTVSDPAIEDSVAEALRRNPSVQTVERNFIRTHFGLRRANAPASGRGQPPALRPNDPLYPAQSWHYEMLDLPRAWRITTGSNTVLVAVVDDGIRFDHPAISANLTRDGYDFVNNNSAIPLCSGGFVGNSGDGDGPDPDPTDPVQVSIDPQFHCIQGPLSSGNHGLHVAGTVGARGNDGIGVTGVAWNVRIRPVRVLGLAGGTDYDIAQGLVYAAGLPADNGLGGLVVAPSGARIINMSLGGPNPSAISQNAVSAATAAGSLIIASAGNSATSAPNYPAAYPQVLSVSALGPDFALASYSSFGSTIDVAAPGGDLQDGGGFSSFGVMSTAYNFTNFQPIYDNATWQGTSMAAPHVSGVAALLLSANPGLSAAQLRSRLETYAVDLGPAGPDQAFGRGLVSARNSLTQSFAPPTTTYVKLINAATGGMTALVAAQPNGTYQFNDVPPSTYFLYAGQDEDSDGLVGINPRRWGAYGSTANPATVTVSGPGIQTINFSVGYPIEVESNNSLQGANTLPVGGYVVGVISNPVTDVDVMRVLIPSGGTYTFETEGLFGSCAYALEEDTMLELLSSSGSRIAFNNDINTANRLYCSRITTMLSPGTYYLRVLAFTGQGAPGLLNRRYTVSVRSGP